MGYSPWGRKEPDTTERISTAHSIREQNNGKHRARMPSFPTRVTSGETGRAKQHGKQGLSHDCFSGLLPISAA